MRSRSLLACATKLTPPAVTFYGIQSRLAKPQISAPTASASLSLGPAYPDRVIWVALPTMGAGGSGNSTALALTVSGQPANLQSQATASGHSNPFGISYWSLTDDGALGTSATLQASFITDQVHMGFVVFTTARGALDQVDFYADIQSKDLATNGTLTTVAGGWAFYCAISQNATGGLNPSYPNGHSFDIGSNEWCTIGYVAPTTGQTLPVGPQPNAATGQNNLLSALSMH